MGIETEVAVAVAGAHRDAAIGAFVHECVGITRASMQNMPCEYHALDDDQRERIDAEADQRYRFALHGLLESLASGGHTRIPATLECFNQGKQNVVKLVVSDSVEKSARNALSDFKMCPVTIVLVHADVFKNAPEKPADDSGQGDLLDGVASHLSGDSDDSET